MNDCITTNNKTILRKRSRSGQHFKIYEIRLFSSALLLLPLLYTSSFSLQAIKQITLGKDLLERIKFLSPSNPNCPRRDFAQKAKSRGGTPVTRAYIKESTYS